MSSLKLKTFAFLSDPHSLRWALFGLALASLLASLGAPDSVLACSPASGAGADTCAGT